MHFAAVLRNDFSKNCSTIDIPVYTRRWIYEAQVHDIYCTYNDNAEGVPNGCASLNGSNTIE